MHGRWILPLALIAGGAAASAAPSLGDRQIASIDLSKPFAARSPWRFTATQGPTVDDPTEIQGPIPGAIRLCLSKDGGRSCGAQFDGALHVWEGDDPFDVPHYLNAAQIIYPRGAGGRPLLLVALASQHSDNGDQRVATVVLSYSATADRFTRVYAQATGRNNNQEIRYIANGALQGAIVFAEPTENAPFGFWITVSRPAGDDRYVQALRYRSATRYGDGNPLAVIDSEMPNIQQRLGLWRPGKPPPVPKGCAKPRLVKTELWCN